MLLYQLGSVEGVRMSSCGRLVVYLNELASLSGSRSHFSIDQLNLVHSEQHPALQYQSNKSFPPTSFIYAYSIARQVLL